MKNHNARHREFLKETARDWDMTYVQVLRIYNKYGFNNFYTQLQNFVNNRRKE